MSEYYRNKILEMVENLIDERKFTSLETYKETEPYKLDVQMILDGIEDLAWNIENDMDDSL